MPRKEAMSYLVRIWFKSPWCWPQPQEIRLSTGRGINVYQFRGWTYVAANGKALVKYHAELERAEVVSV